MSAQVLVIGGGLAGLTAARALHRAGVGFQLIEARERLGGRILSTDATGDGMGPFDLGPFGLTLRSPPPARPCHAPRGWPRTLRNRTAG